MGYASLFEDIIEQRDAGSYHPLLMGGGAPPSPESVAERKRLDRETLASTIAAREFQKNLVQAEQKALRITSLKNLVRDGVNELLQLRSEASKAIHANHSLTEELAKYRTKYGERSERPDHNRSSSPPALAALLAKIEIVQEAEVASRECLEKLNSYARSQWKLEVQALERRTLVEALKKLDIEIETLRALLGDVDRANCCLSNQTRTLQCREVMDEWLRDNPVFAAKEHAQTAEWALL